MPTLLSGAAFAGPGIVEVGYRYHSRRSVHRAFSLEAAVHSYRTALGLIQTIVPIDADGNFDLSFSGMVMEMKPFGPPLSALPYAVRMTREQFDQLKKLTHKKGDQQEILERIRQCVRERDGEIYSLIISTDMN